MTANPYARRVRPETAALLYGSGIGSMIGLRTRGSHDRRHYANELRKLRHALRTYWAPATPRH